MDTIELLDDIELNRSPAQEDVKLACKCNRRLTMNEIVSPFGCFTLSRLFPHSKLWNSKWLYKYSILIITYFAYVTYHMTRKAVSVVKPAWHDDNGCGRYDLPNGTDWDNGSWCDWKPFDKDKDTARSYFMEMDLAYQLGYALAMFAAGSIADRMSLRIFLVAGMILSSLSSFLLALAWFLEIHKLEYFIVVQAFAGIVQSSGWPAVVNLVGNWWGNKNRGLIMGIWNSHTSVGNIIGNELPAVFLKDVPFKPWGWSFVVPALIMLVMAGVVWLFVIDHPANTTVTKILFNDSDAAPIIATSSMVKHGSTDDTEQTTEIHPSDNSDTDDLIGNVPITSGFRETKAVGFLQALLIPGVVEFSLGLLFAKSVAYTFLYWLPSYLESSFDYSDIRAANIASLFDVGGIFGGIAAGVISDRYKMPALTCSVFLFLAGPILFIITAVKSPVQSIVIILLIIAGFFVNGPYALITTAVSAQLGEHKSLHGNSRAMATVTAIIDGTGSLGAAVGPFIAGWLSKIDKDWTYFFYFLIVCNILSMLLLLRLTICEILLRRRSRSHAEDEIAQATEATQTSDVGI